MTRKHLSARNKSTQPAVVRGRLTGGGKRAGKPVAPIGAGEIAVARPDPVIRIEIGPSLSGGFVANRFDVMIVGRAMSAAPIAEIRLLVGEQVTSTSRYGVPEHAAACTMPDGSFARQRAFQFNLPRLSLDLPEVCRCRIVARLEDGFESAEDFTLAIDPSGDRPVDLVSGTKRPETTTDNALPDAVMYIERATIDDDGWIQVQGWTVAFGSLESLWVVADGDRIGEPLAGAARPDVAAIFPAYPNALSSGFSLGMPLPEAYRRATMVRVEAVYANGFARSESIPIEWERYRNEPEQALAQVGGVVVAPEAAPIDMYCDAAVLTADGFLSLNGWAVCATGIAQVRVLLDGYDVGLASYGHQRVDVAGIYPDIKMAHLSGFRFDQHLGSRYEGLHEVRVVVCGAQGGDNQRIGPVVANEAASAPSFAQRDRSTPHVTAEQAGEFRLELDAPTLLNGAMIEPVTGRMTIEGWLLTRSGIKDFRVLLDDQLLGHAHCGLARQDVGTAFPDWPNALRSGFAFHCPPRSLRDGEHTVRMEIRANSGVALTRSFRIEVKKPDDHEDAVAIRRRIPRVEADLMLSLLAGLDQHPGFQFILRQGRPVDIDALRVTFNALRLQAYPDWTVTVLAEDDDTASVMRGVIDDEMPRFADRFSVWCPAMIAVWNAPLGGGRGMLHWLLRPGDEPGADALLAFAVARFRHPDADLLYGDEVRVSPISGEQEPFFKPDFSPDLLLSTNYPGRGWVVTGDLLAKTGATAAGLVATGEYDLLLRCAEQAGGVRHIPKLLCQRGAGATDDPATEQAALRRMLERRGVAGAVLATPVAGTWRVKRAVPTRGRVSIIIPTCGSNGYIETCITSLRARTSYPDFEIICIDNIPHTDVAWKVWLRENADKTVDVPGDFNWSVFNNRGSEAADGDYLLFLNDDMEILHDDWLDAMMEHAQRPEVAAVGPQLLYREGTVQHAGMFLSNNGIGRHAFRFAAKDDPCYFGLALTQRNVIAVTGACMLVRRETFERLGRFDAAHQITNNDLDFCLRAHQAGLLTVYTPYASLTHYELASRASMKDVYDLTHFDAAWKTTFAAGDPYFSPRLSKQAEDYRPDDEPVQWVVAGGPLFNVAEIERILVVKLDHIGDFVTALPPIRRLRKIFPRARITVLAGPASAGFIALEPCIDEFIPFSFFHTRSQLGERALTQADYAALAEQLRPYQFDLAVDLRKHPSTRDVLKYTGARYLAGFDYLGQFPFLDIALDWDGDRKLQRKRGHIVDDLLALVDAVGHATEADRLLMQPGPAAMPLGELPEAARALFTRPVVAIHPGAGNVTKQWPEAHFSALIDLLVERNHVNILLVGGSDDVELAESLMQSVLHKDAIASMAGQTSLADLPRLLKTCALYVGNDSGPKHVAAAVGIPTIGIHSGVVDPMEWGPIGPTAVALRRNMTCSPCYLAKAEDCPRSLACLKLFDPALVYEAADLLLRPAGVGEGAKPAWAAGRRLAMAEPA